MTELQTLWLVGCGNMGGAMLSRWIGAGMDPKGVTVIDPGAPAVPDGVRVILQAPDEPPPKTLVLAVKPQLLDAVAPDLARFKPRLLLSILAGVEAATLGSRLSADTIIRAMPNLPVAIGQGVTALYGDATDTTARKMAEALAVPLGRVEWIEDEHLFDAVTALSGCGPGFVFRFVEMLAKAGASLGLPQDQALRLAQATVAGSSAMASQSAEAPGLLADRVASPGGSTREGLNVLDSGNALESLLEATLKASFDRNRAMAHAARG